MCCTFHTSKQYLIVHVISFINQPCLTAYIVRQQTWLKHWRSKLEANSADPILINQLVQEILRCSDHPFTELLHRYQMQIYQRLYPLVANKHEEIDIVQVSALSTFTTSHVNIYHISCQHLAHPMSTFTTSKVSIYHIIVNI